jgi:exopolysaccharide production protein ExoZ
LIAVPAFKPAPAPGTPRRPARLVSLQILRFLAAFLVVLFHLGSGLEQSFGLSSNIFFFGASGVDVFFVLSGFIIAYTTDPARGVIHFLKRRVARIVPLYWFLTSGVVLIALIAPSLLQSTEVTPETLWRSYLFLPYEKDNGFTQPLLFLGWTLCYEAYFYAIFAASLIAGRFAPWVACTVIFYIFLIGLLWPEGSVLWRFYTDPIIVEFLFGVLLHRLYLHWPAMREGSRPLAGGLFAAGVAFYVLLFDSPDVFGKGVSATLIVAAFLCLKLSGGRILALLVLLGDASYSLYLSHPYVLQLPIRTMGEDFGFIPTALVASSFVALAVLVSLALFFAVERPAQSFLLRLFGEKHVPRVQLPSLGAVFRSPLGQNLRILLDRHANPAQFGESSRGEKPRQRPDGHRAYQR